MNELFEIQEYVIVVLALLSCVGLGMRAYVRKNLALVGDIIPRLYIAAIYSYFAIYMGDSPMEFKSYLVRYGLTALLLTEVIYDLTLMWNRVNFLWGKYEKHDTN